MAGPRNALEQDRRRLANFCTGQKGGFVVDDWRNTYYGKGTPSALALTKHGPKHKSVPDYKTNFKYRWGTHVKNPGRCANRFHLPVPATAFSGSEHPGSASALQAWKRNTYAGYDRHDGASLISPERRSDKHQTGPGWDFVDSGCRPVLDKQRLLVPGSPVQPLRQVRRLKKQVLIMLANRWRIPLFNSKSKTSADQK